MVLDEYPESKVYFYGSTSVRTRLYQILISKYIQEADNVYLVKGIKNNIEEIFVKNVNYDAFLISLND